MYNIEVYNLKYECNHFIRSEKRDRSGVNNIVSSVACTVCYKYLLFSNNVVIGILK